jgi:hypothetical protein
MDNLRPVLKKEVIVVPIVLVLFIALSLASMVGRSLTYDEPSHLEYGMHILHGDPTRFDDSKMPFSALNALPRMLATYLAPGSFLQTWLQKYQISRLMTLLFSLGIALLCYVWSRKLYGLIPALATLFLYVFDPNIIAHSQLITTDVYALGMTTATLFCLWWFAHQRTWLNGLLFSFVLGLSQVAKYSTVLLFPISALTLILYDAFSLRKTDQPRLGRTILNMTARYLGYFALAGSIALLVINAAFLFDRTFTSFGEYQFRSSLFKAMQSRFPVLNSVKIPTPYPYLEGLDWTIYRDQTDEGHGPVYLLGRRKPLGEGFPGYYIVASIFKLPLASQVVMLMAMIVYVVDSKRRGRFFQDEQFLLIPALFYAIYFNFFNNAQIGYRLYMVFIPLLYVFTGGLFIHWRQQTGWKKILSVSLAGWLIVSTLFYFPYYLTYFNELVVDKRLTYRYLSDSNLDWGQDRYQFESYLIEHPDVRTEVDGPQAGHFILSSNRLTGVNLGDGNDPDQYEWLAKNFIPDETLANYYFIFDISPEEIAVFCQSTTVCK